ncbi:unnamed protein product [Aureobasidium pullulans]|nr:unnamed protein product [Aureobasidium pullulans]
MSDVDYYSIFPGSSLFYTGTTPSPTRDEHQHEPEDMDIESVDEDVLGPDDPIPTWMGYLKDNHPGYEGVDVDFAYVQSLPDQFNILNNGI